MSGSMAGRHRAYAVASVVVVLGLLAGCGLPLPRLPGQPDVTPVPLPPDRLVLSVESISPMVPELAVALSGLGLAIYGDGRVMTLREGGGYQRVPAAYAVADAGADAAARLAAEAEAGGLFDPDTDYGYPSATDLPATVLTLHGASGPRKVVVGGLSESFDSDVSFGQRRLRRQLRAFVEQARALPGEAVQREYEVDRVAVRELATRTPSAAAPRWPGPDPGTFLAATDRGYGVVACGRLTGRNARTAYAAARTNPDQVWSVGGGQRTLVVAPVLPGQEPCPA